MPVEYSWFLKGDPRISDFSIAQVLARLVGWASPLAGVVLAVFYVVVDMATVYENAWDSGHACCLRKESPKKVLSR